MTSAILEIDFEQEENLAQYRCSSDGSSVFEEKSATPLRTGAKAKTLGTKAASPSKRGSGGLVDTCRNMYEEVKKNLRRANSNGTAAQQHQATTYEEPSDIMDEEGAPKAENARLKPAVASHQTRPPARTQSAPMSKPLRKASNEDSDDEDGLNLIRPPPMKARSAYSSSALPFKTRVGSSQEGLQQQPSTRMLATTSTKPSLIRGIRPPPATPPNDDSTIRPPADNDDSTIRPPADSFDEEGGLTTPARKQPDLDISGIAPPPQEDASVLSDPSHEGTPGQNESTLLGIKSDEKKWVAIELVKSTILGKVAASRWSCAQVGDFLEACGLAMYVRNFAENGVDGPCLLELHAEQIQRGLYITEKMHLLSLERGVEWIRARKIKTAKDWEWSHARTLEWLEAKGLGVLIPKFKAEAVHGGVLFSLNVDQFVSDLDCNSGSVLHLMSLLACIERARVVGPRRSGDEVPDWSPARVKTWLESLSLGHLVPVFRHFSVNGALLLYLDAPTMMEEMHLTEIQALVLDRAIQKLRKHQSKQTSVWRSSLRHIGAFLQSVKTKIMTSMAKQKNAASGSNAAASATTTPIKQQPKKTAASSARSTARSTAVEFSQGTLGALSSTYSKYGGRKNQKKFMTLKNEPASIQKRPAPVTSQQPVSPPNRPPRPNAAATSAAKPLRATSSQGSTVRQANEKYGGSAAKADTSNSMSIL